MHIKVDEGDLINRHVHYSEAAFPDSDGKDAPPWDFKPIPAGPLHSQEAYEAERDKIFRKRWINIAREWEAEVNVNYKVFIDAFQETYHVSFIHRSSFTGEIEEDTDPYFNLKYMRFFGPHKALAVPSRGSPETNVRQKVIRQDGENVRQGINLDGIVGWGFDIDVVFPNFFYNILNNQYFTHNFWPVGPHKTHWECHLYLPRTDKASDLITWEREKCLLRDAINEDVSTNEATQVSLNSGHIKYLHYSEQETSLRHHYYYMKQFTK